MVEPEPEVVIEGEPVEDEGEDELWSIGLKLSRPRQVNIHICSRQVVS